MMMRPSLKLEFRNPKRKIAGHDSSLCVETNIKEEASHPL